MGYIVLPNLIFLVISLLIHESTAGCSFPQHNAENEKLEAQIQPLLGKRYTATDVSKEYLYVIGICADAVDVTEFPDANNQHIGVFQIMIVDGKPDFQRSHIIGKYSNAALTRGTGWILLEYKDGDQYNSHCNKENRRAKIMIICDEDVSVGSETVKIFEENTNKTDGCYYLFEMASSAVCPAKLAHRLLVNTV